MEKQNKSLFVLVIMLTVAVFTMAIGFAVQSYNATLEINGTSTFKAAKWEVKFDEDTYAETEGSVEATSHSLDSTTMTFKVTLPKPDTFYEASANVINTGTFDANLVSITIVNPLTADQKKFASFTFTYDGTDYTTSADSLTIPIANTTGVKKATVRIDYLQPDDEADLPATDLEDVEFTVTLNYEQA